jgi:surface antigen
MEFAIRSLPQIVKQTSETSGLAKTVTKISPSNQFSKLKKNHRKRLVRFGILAGNLLIVLAVFGLIVTQNDKNTSNYSALNTATESKQSNPLDALSAADIAVNVALMTELPETGLIILDADSVKSELTTSVTAREAVLKPQILSEKIKTKEDIRKYVVAEGDKLDDLVAKFGVTSDSIRWSNNLSSSYLKVGTTLYIPPINGIVHKVVSGDTAATLASKYSANETLITQFNDAEISGLKANEYVVVPDGKVKAVAVARSTPYYSGFAFGNTAIYGYNGYVPGYCTWYVANKRIQIGRPVPANLGNAATWDNFAPQGWNRTPAAGAAVVTGERGAGHVAFVEKVNPDGSVLISEMNRRRRYETTSRVLSPGEAAGYKYIH